MSHIYAWGEGQGDQLLSVIIYYVINKKDVDCDGQQTNEKGEQCNL